MVKTVVITNVKRGNPDNPIVLHYEGDDGRPFKPCKTVRRILSAAWGTDGNNWIGQSATLFCDNTVVYGGKEVGGIRVSALSGISKPLNVKLAVTRGKKKEYRIEPLQDKPAVMWPDDKFKSKLDSIKPKIASGEKTPEQAITWFEQTAKLTDEQRQKVRDILPTVDDELFDDGE